MRELALDEPAGLVYCPFRALLHLPTWADKRQTFQRVAAGLRPGGRFAWNAFVFDPFAACTGPRRGASPGQRRPDSWSTSSRRLRREPRRRPTSDVGTGLGAPNGPRSSWWRYLLRMGGPDRVGGPRGRGALRLVRRPPVDERSSEFVWATRTQAGVRSARRPDRAAVRPVEPQCHRGTSPSTSRPRRRQAGRSSSSVSAPGGSRSPPRPPGSA